MECLIIKKTKQNTVSSWYCFHSFLFLRFVLCLQNIADRLNWRSEAFFYDAQNSSRVTLVVLHRLSSVSISIRRQRHKLQRCRATAAPVLIKHTLYSSVTLDGDAVLFPVQMNSHFFFCTSHPLSSAWAARPDKTKGTFIVTPRL